MTTDLKHGKTIVASLNKEGRIHQGSSPDNTPVIILASRSRVGFLVFEGLNKDEFDRRVKTHGTLNGQDLPNPLHFKEGDTYQLADGVIAIGT